MNETVKALVTTDEDPKNAGFPVVIARAEVVLFAAEMERTLRTHDATKGQLGWKNASIRGLSEKLGEEFDELLTELNTLCKQAHGVYLDGTPAEDADDSQTSAAMIRNEAVDLANICMMIADCAGGLRK